MAVPEGVQVGVREELPVVVPVAVGVGSAVPIAEYVALPGALAVGEEEMEDEIVEGALDVASGVAVVSLLVET